MFRIILLSAAVAMLGTACAHKKKDADEAVAQAQTATTKAEKKAASAVAHAEAKIEGAVTCKNGKDERVLAVKKADGGCELMYTKMGETKSIANSRSGTNFCDEKLKHVQNNLTTAGYQCQ